MTKVLIIEDDDTIANAYGLALQKDGYEVHMAPDGLKGLQMAENIHPDIIMLDLLMPNMGGLEFLKAFEADHHPNTKVLVFTNMLAPSTMSAAEQLGAIKYLTKSDYTPKEISELIKQLSVKPE